MLKWISEYNWVWKKAVLKVICSGAESLIMYSESGVFIWLWYEVKIWIDCYKLVCDLRHYTCSYLMFLRVSSDFHLRQSSSGTTGVMVPVGDVIWSFFVPFQYYFFCFWVLEGTKLKSSIRSFIIPLFLWAKLFVSSWLIFKFLCKKPNILFALAVMLLVWVSIISHDMLSDTSVWQYMTSIQIGHA